MKANRKVTLAAIAVALVAAVAASAFAYKISREKTIEEAFSRLTLFHGLRRATVEDYMLSKASDIRAMSRNDRVVDTLMAFQAAWAELGEGAAQTVRRLYIDDNPFRKGKKRVLRSAGDNSRYTAVHGEFHQWAQRFVGHFGYQDLYLIDRDGNVVYTVEKQDDLATNVAHGKYRNTPLGFVFRRSVRPGGRDVNLSDFETYAPSDETPAAFASGAVLGKDGKIAGVFAVQFPPEPINEMLRSTGGMGKTGQTYIVGNDMMMRSQSRFAAYSTMLRTEVRTRSVTEGLKGFSGSGVIFDYRDVPVLSVYAPLDFGGPLWILLAEIERSEALRKFSLWPTLLAGLLAAIAAGAAAYLVGRMFFRN